MSNVPTQNAIDPALAATDTVRVSARDFDLAMRSAMALCAMGDRIQALVDHIETRPHHDPRVQLGRASIAAALRAMIEKALSELPSEAELTRTMERPS